MNIKDISSCFGCGVCAIACPKKIIDIRLDEDGFYTPRISDTAKCTQCGVCVDVCSYSHEDLALKAHSLPQKISYAAWSKDPAIRKKCSSGGAAFEVGRALIKEGFKVCGVRYEAEKNRAEHYIATTVEELFQSIGSKYIQSYTVDGFRLINRKEKYFVTGTPCQIDSFRRYIQKFHCEDNFVLLDFFCHGVPSKLMWDKYIQRYKAKLGNLTYVSWRNKSIGWHKSWVISVDGGKNGKIIDRNNPYSDFAEQGQCSINSFYTESDEFFTLFLSNSCLNKPCYEKCRFKWDQSSADIRVGDLWGTTYKAEERGVSGVVVFTEKGKNVLLSCECELTEHPFSVIAQRQMTENPAPPAYSPKVWKSLKKEKASLSSASKYPRRQRFKRRLKLRFNRLLRMLGITAK